MKKYLSILFIVMFVTVLMAFVPKTANDPWPVPDKYKNMANPVKSDATSLATGKALFNQHCKSCHGSKGKGDGPKAAQLNTECGDFTKPSTQSETDGPYFIKHPKDVRICHHSKRKLLIQNEIWAVVNYYGL
jgi:Cytochrome c, mono- and diheme variants